MNTKSSIVFGASSLAGLSQAFRASKPGLLKRSSSSKETILIEWREILNTFLLHYYSRNHFKYVSISSAIFSGLSVGA